MGIPKGGRRMVREYVDGTRERWPPWKRLSDEEANTKLAWKLVDDTLDRLQGGQRGRTTIELAVTEELASRYSPEDARAFARDVEDEWIYQHEKGYPASTEPREAKQGGHATPGHVCWEPLRELTRRA